MRHIIATAALAALLVPGAAAQAVPSADEVEALIEDLPLDVEIATHEHAGVWGMGGVRPVPNVDVPPTTSLTPGTFYPASSELIDGVGDANLYHLVEVDEGTVGFINAEAVRTYRTASIDPATLTEPATATRAEVVYAAAVQDVRQGLYGEGEVGELREGEEVRTVTDVDRLFEGMLPVRISDGGMVGWVSEGAIALDAEEEATTTEPAEDSEPEELGDVEPVAETPPAATPEPGPAEDDDSLPVGLLVGLGAGVLVVGGLAVARARGRSQPAAEELTYDDGDDAIEELVYKEDEK